MDAKAKMSHFLPLNKNNNPFLLLIYCFLGSEKVCAS